MGLSWSSLKQRRSAKTLQELVPRKTPGHETPIPQLTRDILLSSLGNVAKYIEKKKGDVTVVAVGGAVNTIHLQSRAVTHDVDFFNNNLTPKDFELLINGAKDAVKKEKNSRKTGSITEQFFSCLKNKDHYLLMRRSSNARLSLKT